MKPSGYSKQSFALQNVTWKQAKNMKIANDSFSKKITIMQNTHRFTEEELQVLLDDLFLSNSTMKSNSMCSPQSNKDVVKPNILKF